MTAAEKKAFTLQEYGFGFKKKNGLVLYSVLPYAMDYRKKGKIEGFELRVRR